MLLLLAVLRPVLLLLSPLTLMLVHRRGNLTPPIHCEAYKSWLASQSTGELADPTTATDSSQRPTEPSGVPNVSGTEASTPVPEPAYPSSFAHIVELITTGQPIPGIEEIPDTVLTGHDIASEKPRRRKPWEKDDAAPAQDEMIGNAA